MHETPDLCNYPAMPNSSDIISKSTITITGAQKFVFILACKYRPPETAAGDETFYKNLKS